ncbi:LysR family transcriptional regulator [Saccharospirillum salsuginis]|uniref:Transcriptional regulator n=1 Tax=Saccharospirillum salsuginis TaxID=418750 RepID=A0A918N741_9GAMM|nr:LysR family transcriptional regulator [Saccharospirillum salsuginis]GGX42899.1 transcriptional regulator [Saccharospirillum salsuginis]
MYSLTDVNLFLRAAEAGSLSAAARQLNLTPAAASAALKRLEAQLNVRLFERSTRSLRLTPEGEVFAEHGRGALGMLADGEALIGARSRTVSGEVHLSAPTDLARTWLSGWLDDCLGRHPDLRLVLHVSDALHDLTRESVDIALRYGDLQDSSLIARRLTVSEQVACASPDYLARHGTPRHPRELAHHNCLTFYSNHRPRTTWTFQRDGKTHEVRVEGDRRADDSALVHQWALEGAGIIYKSRLDLMDDLQQGHLVPLFPAFRGPEVALNALYPSKRYLPLRTRRVLDDLVECFAN